MFGASNDRDVLHVLSIPEKYLLEGTSFFSEHTVQLPYQKA
jgi:hypothetical protein